MPFSDFHGNGDTVRAMREMLARGHFPHAIILSGPPGSGKFTLAQMMAKAMNCLERPVTERLPDFCGRCANCVRIAEADALEERCAEAVEVRENLREADRRETRIFVQTHPDVLIVPPDPPQMLVKVDQVRHVIREIYFRPVEGRERVYIFSDADFMKEAANALLKVLEEPPQFATLFLLTDNPAALLPTIRSRCMQLRLAPLAAGEIEQYLAEAHPEWKPRERQLVARVCAGGLGRARNFDLVAYQASRQDALVLLGAAMQSPGGGGSLRPPAEDHSVLFRMTDAYRSGAEGKAKTGQLVRTTYSLLQDLLFLRSGTPEMVRNQDIQPHLARMAEQVDFAWITHAAQRLGDLESGMRRNLLRSLALDSFAAALER
ncbi:MAG TPA: DNA polymerase III subunit [Candidatus Binatia bacterium]|nr:DNA polymerase III subunit [Candidatus Binatia bacterium]